MAQTRTPLSRSKGQGHQAVLLSAALTREAGAAVTVRTYWAWETAATLRLLGGARGAGAPTGGAEGRGISCRHAHSLFTLVKQSVCLCPSERSVRVGVGGIARVSTVLAVLIPIQYIVLARSRNVSAKPVVASCSLLDISV